MPTDSTSQLCSRRSPKMKYYSCKTKTRATACKDELSCPPGASKQKVTGIQERKALSCCRQWGPERTTVATNCNKENSRTVQARESCCGQKNLVLKLQHSRCKSCSPPGPIFWGTLYFPSSTPVRVLSRVELDHGGSTRAVFTGPSAQPLQHTTQPQTAAAKLWEHGHPAEKEQHGDSSSF